MKIVHQLGKDLDGLVRQALIKGTECQMLPQDAPWDIPQDAQILLVNHGTTKQLPKDGPPAGWPWSLKWIHFRSTGIDGLPPWLFEVETATVSRGAQAVSIAEYVLGAMLLAEKRFDQNRVQRRDDWVMHLQGDLAGKVFGLIGLGNIALACAQRARAFDMQIIGCRRHPGRPTPEGIEMGTMDQVLGRADHLLISAPLTKATDGMIDATAFSKMKTGAHLINVGRGRIVKTDALKQALDSGRLSRATLDVIDPEPPEPGHWVYDHPNIHLTAHDSAFTSQTICRSNAILAQNLRAYLGGKPEHLIGVVDPNEGY